VHATAQPSEIGGFSAFCFCLSCGHQPFGGTIIILSRVLHLFAVPLHFRVGITEFVFDSLSHYRINIESGVWWMDVDEFSLERLSFNNRWVMRLSELILRGRSETPVDLLFIMLCKYDVLGGSHSCIITRSPSDDVQQGYALSVLVSMAHPA
jgi:hypothetical protein